MREATVNAATHAGVSEVSVFVEAGEREVTAYVRDRGKGFNPAAVPSDRHGIAHSIRARLERHGGRVTITTAPGRGTEVELRIPRTGGSEEDS
jgi:signal transduction histidine kinase